MRASVGSILVVIALLGANHVAADESLEAARRAFNAGDNQRALTLYEEVLVADPDNVDALVHSAMLLSWEQRFDEALARYDRCLALEPDHPKALLERAKVLSWNRRFDEAAGAFRELLERDPSDREARLGLARSLSWSGDQPAAREQYRLLLDADGEDAAAMVGMAQTHAWSSENARAREWYARALQQQPGMKDAEVGLAYLDLWSGAPSTARGRADRLERNFPDDPEVEDLRQAIDRAHAPWVRSSYDAIDDTDGNELGILRVEGGLGFVGDLDFRVGYARWDMRDGLDRSASTDGLYGVLGWNLAPAQRLELRAGLDRIENTAGSDDTQGVGGITWIYRPEGPWQLRAALRRDPYLYSTEILDNGILIDALELGGYWKPTDRWRVDGSLGFWELSDGNARTNLLASGFYGWRLRPLTLEAGYALQYQNYTENLSNGYFDPQGFIANLAVGRARGKFGSTRHYWEAEATVGLQSFELGGIEVSNDTVLGGRLLAGFPFGAGITLELYFNRTDYALQSASGFSSNGGGLRLRWQGGN